MKTLLHITTKCINGAKPVESGQRATKFGYHKLNHPYKIFGTWKNFKNIYTGVFVKIAGKDLHMTWDFNPQKCKFPEGVRDGDKAKLTVYGFYEDEDVECLIVKWEDKLTQP